SKRPGNESRPVGRAKSIAGLTRQGGRGPVELVSQLRQTVVTLSNRRGAERIGFNDIRAGFQILPVYLADDVWPHQTEQLIVALDIFAVIGKPLAAEIILGQLVLLD